MIETDADRRIFFEDDGVAISFTLSDNSVVDKDADGNTLLGLFDNDYVNPQLGEMNLDSSQPVLTCLSCDIAAVKKEDTVSVGGVTYEISHIKADGMGMSIIFLVNNYD